jgi:hypothetical protein
MALDTEVVIAVGVEDTKLCLAVGARARAMAVLR